MRGHFLGREEAPPHPVRCAGTTPPGGRGGSDAGGCSPERCYTSPHGGPMRWMTVPSPGSLAIAHVVVRGAEAVVDHAVSRSTGDGFERSGDGAVERWGGGARRGGAADPGVGEPARGGSKAVVTVQATVPSQSPSAGPAW